MAQSLQSFFPSTVRDPQHAKEPTIALGNPHAIYKTSQPKTNPLLVLDRRFVHQILPTVFEVLNTMSTGDYKVSRPSIPFPVLFCPVLSCPVLSWPNALPHSNPNSPLNSSFLFFLSFLFLFLRFSSLFLFIALSLLHFRSLTSASLTSVARKLRLLRLRCLDLCRPVLSTMVQSPLPEPALPVPCT